MRDLGPPAYAWDWLARQRVVWREIRRRLIADDLIADDTGPDRPAAPGDVPDWSADHPDLSITARAATLPHQPGADLSRDYRAIDTRADMVAALRADYPHDAHIRSVVDAVVAEIAFLRRLDVRLEELGVRSAPRGMRWWWCHLGGTGLDDGAPSVGDRDARAASTPTQLRLVDVLSGYGDAPDP